MRKPTLDRGRGDYPRPAIIARGFAPPASARVANGRGTGGGQGNGASLLPYCIEAGREARRTSAMMGKRPQARKPAARQFRGTMRLPPSIALVPPGGTAMPDGPDRRKSRRLADAIGSRGGMPQNQWSGQSRHAW